MATHFMSVRTHSKPSYTLDILQEAGKKGGNLTAQMAGEGCADSQCRAALRWRLRPTPGCAAPQRRQATAAPRAAASCCCEVPLCHLAAAARPAPTPDGMAAGLAAGSCCRVPGCGRAVLRVRPGRHCRPWSRLQQLTFRPGRGFQRRLASLALTARRRHGVELRCFYLSRHRLHAAAQLACGVSAYQQQLASSDTCPALSRYVHSLRA